MCRWCRIHPGQESSLYSQGEAVMGPGAGGMYRSLPAQELLQQLHVEALGARSLPPKQRSCRSQHPASIATSHPRQGHNWLQVASESHFGLQEPRE